METPELVAVSCRLAGLTVEDAVAWRAGEDAEQLRWFESEPSSLDDVVRAINRWRQEWADDGDMRQWGIWRRGVLAGGVELQVRPGRWANISYVVWLQFRGRGLATEAVRLATAWGLDHLPVTEVVATTHRDNDPSQHVLRAAGFVDEGLAGPETDAALLRFVCRAAG